MKVMVTVDFSVEECRAIADAHGDGLPRPMDASKTGCPARS